VAQAISRWPIAAEALFRLQARPSEIYGGQNDPATIFFSLSIPISPVSIIPPMLLPGGKKGETWESSK